MKIGIIVLYQGEFEVPDWECKKELLTHLTDIEVCIVGGNSLPGWSEQLSGHLEGLESVSILNLRKVKSELSTIRAGARFMYNRFQFEHLGHVSCSSYHEISQIIKMVQANKEALVNWNQNKYLASVRKPTQLQSVFSLTEFCESIDIDCTLVCEQ